MHLVQRVPKTEAQGRVHTSACTVAVMPEADDVEIQIHDKDLCIDTFCSGGNPFGKISDEQKYMYLANIDKFDYLATLVIREYSPCLVNPSLNLNHLHLSAEEVDPRPLREKR